MSQYVPIRFVTFIVIIAMLLGSTHTAWAAAPSEMNPRQAVKSRVIEVQEVRKVRSSSTTAQSTGTTRGERTKLLAQAYPAAQFSEAERMQMQQRQQQASDLKQYKGGDVIVIGGGALLVILVVVLIVVLVDD